MTKNSLRARYEEFEKRGDLVTGYVRQKLKYPDKQKIRLAPPFSWTRRQAT